MENRIQALYERRRMPGIGMTEHDLAELYTFLELFKRVYLGLDCETDKILCGIRQIFSLEFAVEDSETVLKKLRNPRNAGRRPKYLVSDRVQAEQLFNEGHSIRQIANMTGIPKSTVQRLLSVRSDS